MNNTKIILLIINLCYSGVYRVLSVKSQKWKLLSSSEMSLLSSLLSSSLSPELSIHRHRSHFNHHNCHDHHYSHRHYQYDHHHSGRHNYCLHGCQHHFLHHCHHLYHSPHFFLIINAILFLISVSYGTYKECDESDGWKENCFINIHTATMIWKSRLLVILKVQ